MLTLKKEHQPVKYGKIAQVPVVMQLEYLECGAACVSMVLAYYEKYITLEEAREACGVSRDGQNALNMVKALRSYGMEAGGYRMEPEDFKKFKNFPCIIHWGFNHFVVLKGIRGNKYYLNDPAVGEKTVTAEEFDGQFTGIVLAMEPAENFLPSGKPRSIYSYAKKRLVGTAAAVAFAILTAIIGNLLSVINPVFSRIFMDRLITGKNPEWLNAFMVLMILVGLVSVLNSLIQRTCSLKINGRMAVSGDATFMWKVLHLPMKFFSQRMAGDIQSRQGSAASISNTLVNTLAPLVLDAGMMLFYLVIMIRNSIVISALGILTTLMNFYISTIISKKRVNISRASMQSAGKLAATATAAMEGIETIKASGAEVGIFGKWAGYQAAVNNSEVMGSKLDAYWGLLPQFVSLLLDHIILIYGAYLIILGQFTYGSVMFLQGIISSFMSPAQTLISTRQTLQEMRTEMERLEDVTEYPEDDILKSLDGENVSFRKLTGNMELKNVTFGYSPLGKPLIENFNMKLEPGKKVAFVGSSGCGKSTLSKLISGMYAPWSGEILFDGKPMAEIDRSVFRSSVSVVDQDIILFNDTIKENIRMWDKSIEDFEVILAARDAHIYDEILEKPGGFDHMLDENGKDLSGGQRQRLEIARALVQDASIIIMDEATSALDALTEFNVVKSITDRGIGCIVIAHRLSTIRDCDEIIVLDHGQVVGRGKHEQLMEECSVYRELVTNE